MPIAIYIIDKISECDRLMDKKQLTEAIDRYAHSNAVKRKA